MNLVDLDVGGGFVRVGVVTVDRMNLVDLDVDSRFMRVGGVTVDRMDLMLGVVDGVVAFDGRDMRVVSRGRSVVLMLQLVGGSFRVHVRIVVDIRGVGDRVSSYMGCMCNCILGRCRGGVMLMCLLMFVLGGVGVGVRGSLRCVVLRVLVVGVVGVVRALLLVHADGVLGLVHHALATGVGVLLAGSLVLHGLSGGLLGVGDDVALSLVTHAGDAVANLVGGGLGVVGGHLVADLVGEVLAAGVSHVDGRFGLGVVW